LLNHKLSELASRLAGTVVKMAGLGLAIPARPQDETKARYFNRQTIADISINWDTMDAETIIALINACNPWNKGAAAKLNYKIIRLLAAQKAEVSEPESDTVLPGTIVAINETGMLVSLRDNGWLSVTYIYTDEGFLNASRIPELGFKVGDKFVNL
jgi:methionyl-tRNA formyltransferase